ncbi:hypothetical protein [Sodalis sp. RH16]|uniref:hypothetical protein n=1 Tax=unclassified Sodalis (in: enterobacteria) TaxID=2636512 RepID=UPI0039B5BBBB
MARIEGFVFEEVAVKAGGATNPCRIPCLACRLNHGAARENARPWPIGLAWNPKIKDVLRDKFLQMAATAILPRQGNAHSFNRNHTKSFWTTTYGSPYYPYKN